MTAFNIAASLRPCAAIPTASRRPVSNAVAIAGLSPWSQSNARIDRVAQTLHECSVAQ